MLCLKSTTDEVSQVFYQSSESRLKYTRAGFTQLGDHSNNGFISSLVASHHVLVRVYPDCVNIRGCFLHDVESVERKLLNTLAEACSLLCIHHLIKSTTGPLICYLRALAG